MIQPSKNPEADPCCAALAQEWTLAAGRLISTSVSSSEKVRLNLHLKIASEFNLGWDSGPWDFPSNPARELAVFLGGDLNLMA